METKIDCDITPINMGNPAFGRFLELTRDAIWDISPLVSVVGTQDLRDYIYHLCCAAPFGCQNLLHESTSGEWRFWGRPFRTCEGTAKDGVSELTLIGERGSKSLLLKMR